MLIDKKFKDWIHKLPIDTPNQQVQVTIVQKRSEVVRALLDQYVSIIKQHIVVDTNPTEDAGEKNAYDQLQNMETQIDNIMSDSNFDGFDIQKLEQIANQKTLEDALNNIFISNMHNKSDENNTYIIINKKNKIHDKISRLAQLAKEAIEKHNETLERIQNIRIKEHYNILQGQLSDVKSAIACVDNLGRDIEKTRNIDQEDFGRDTTLANLYALTPAKQLKYVLSQNIDDDMSEWTKKAAKLYNELLETKNMLVELLKKEGIQVDNTSKENKVTSANININLAKDDFFMSNISLLKKNIRPLKINKQINPKYHTIIESLDDFIDKLLSLSNAAKIICQKKTKICELVDEISVE